MHMTQNKQQGAFVDPPSSLPAWFLSEPLFYYQTVTTELKLHVIKYTPVKRKM
jgi:hypothetical protein